MNVVPVIDIKDGQVVAAQQGQRDHYQPIHSSLCKTSDIGDIIKGLLSIYPFKTIYLADLNAITRTGDNHSLIQQTLQQWPSIHFWLDNGTMIKDLITLTEAHYKPIIGTESQLSDCLMTQDALSNAILSIDFKSAHCCLDPAGLLTQPDCWPNEIIVMSLNRVGSQAGPDLEKLSTFKQQYPEKQWIAAGGIRDQMDLLALQDIGINQALIASALHTGKITAQVIEQCSK